MTIEKRIFLIVTFLCCSIAMMTKFAESNSTIDFLLAIILYLLFCAFTSRWNQPPPPACPNCAYETKDKDKVKNEESNVVEFPACPLV